MRVVSLTAQGRDDARVDVVRNEPFAGAVVTIGMFDGFHLGHVQVIEHVRALAAEASYPFIVGVSGDAFWMSYFHTTGDLGWGGLQRDVLRRGLENFGFPCSFLDEVDEQEAWEALCAALAQGRTVITPLHASAATVLGTGFGGAEWVFVTGIDRGEVLVNCMLGDGLRFTPERFRAGWCQHHPLEEAADDLPIIYAMCVVGDREGRPSFQDMTRAGLAAALEIMTYTGSEKVAFGFDAYTALVEDLQSHRGPEELPPDGARPFLPWLGLGMLHHHGSRWAARDFLAEVLGRGDFGGDEKAALSEAHELYDGVFTDLQRFLQLMPWTLDLLEPAERAAAIRQYNTHREEGRGPPPQRRRPGKRRARTLPRVPLALADVVVTRGGDEV